MGQVGVRALKQNASAVVAQAAVGESITITDRGRPVAQLIPLPTSVLATLIAAGQARQPRQSLRDLGPPPAPTPGRRALSAVLADQRATGRY